MTIKNAYRHSYSFASVRCLLILAIAASVSGCVTSIAMPTPNVYVGRADALFQDLHPELTTNEVHVLYVTDRAPTPDSKSKEAYGYQRSMSQAYGDATVAFGTELSWPDLEQLSTEAGASTKREPSVVAVQEINRLPDTRDALTVIDGLVVLKPEMEAIAAEELGKFHAELSRRLALTRKKQVFIYVHGYNVGFDQSVIDIAQLHHFMGREGVPVVYSWPAGHGGLLRGYNADRESGEFTVFHFKNFLRALATCPAVEGVNIIAHSRGTDVALTSLRELHLLFQGEGQDTSEALKLHNFVIAAPDIDFQVFQQRVGAERLFNATDTFTLYLSDKDRALGLATFLFDSVRRLGRLEETDLTPAQKQALISTDNVSIVEDKMKRRDFFGHGYFIMDPAVSSDLILLLRDGRRPGAEHGRPLERDEGGFWVLADPSYPN